MTQTEKIAADKGPPYPRELYEGDGGWKDGRIGQAYDLLHAVLTDRGDAFRHPLLNEIETLDQEAVDEAD